MYISEEKQKGEHKRIVGTCKFFGLILPLILFYTFPPYLKAHQAIPTYIHDCKSAQTYSSKPTINGPPYVSE